MVSAARGCSLLGDLFWWRLSASLPRQWPFSRVSVSQSGSSALERISSQAAAAAVPTCCGLTAWPRNGQALGQRRASSFNPLAVVLRMQVLCGTQRGPLWPRIFGVRVQAGRYALRGVVSYLRLHISRLCVLRTVLLGKAGPAGHCQGLGQCAGLLRICFHRPPCGPTN
jgi:hypothetical protein